ncbi:hypothetical protein RCL1_001818 [Eukaryota sp. TZLM3-RCL]
MSEPYSAADSWKFCQVFGDRAKLEDIVEADIISTVQFNDDGNMLAVGDRGGRVVLFKRAADAKSRRSVRNVEYKYYAEFQSHQAEFDYLRSLEIDERINKICWLPQQNNSTLLLTTNDKTIKLWKVQDKVSKRITYERDSYINTRSRSSSQPLRVPQLVPEGVSPSSSCKRVFANAHAYSINSLSLNIDGDTFLSADDLRIHLWHLGDNSEAFSMVDIKPDNMEELSEVITTASCSPAHCNYFMYGTSKGVVNLADMRQSAICSGGAKRFAVPPRPSNPNNSYFNEILSSIGDAKFSNSGRYILTRDYLTVKLWDVNMESRPIKNLCVHEQLRSNLCDVYKNDCIFDKFDCQWSGDDSQFMTGSYGHLFNIYETQSTNVTTLEATRSMYKKNATSKTPFPKKPSKGKGLHEVKFAPEDFSRKILSSSWHPKENTVAIGATTNLFIYTYS